MPAFPLLVEPQLYEPNTFLGTYLAHRPAAEGLPFFKSWLEVFRKSISTFARNVLTDVTLGPDEARQAASQAFAATFGAALDALEAQPSQALADYPDCHPISCLTLCRLREICLRRAGARDAFLAVKSAENAAALQLLPSVLATLDAVDALPQRLELALRGVFAGNLFDLGAAGSAAAFETGAAGASGFTSTRDNLVPRPWVADDLDAVVARLAQGTYRHALLFVDNAGSDFVLGMLPLARELLRLGAKVTIAANELPSINDMTAAEVGPLLEEAAGLDPAVVGPALAGGELQFVSSGSDLPVLDLRDVSQSVCDVASLGGVDLVVLEGMGRSIETNLEAQLKVDCLKLGMIKHPEVAACLKGRLYDCVCRFTPGQNGSPAAPGP